LIASFVLYILMDEKSLNEFLNRFSENRNTDAEHQLFIDWLNNAPDQQVEEILEKYQLISEAQTSKASVQYPELVNNIEARLDLLKEEDSQDVYAVKLWPSYKKIAAVAAVFLMMIAFTMYYSVNLDFNQTVHVKKGAEQIKKDVFIVDKKTILSLANGSRIILDDAKNGLLATQLGTSIRKTEKGHIIYSSSSFTAIHAGYNTITTPRGGQYKVTLPDGTKVWLNAASSLKYPASFSGKERNVELKGEAYFEVARQHSPLGNGFYLPFKVTSGNHVVEVLGTHFNIKSYPEEMDITTTLLEGSVKVSQDATHKSQLLLPGQQAITGNNIKVKNVDPTQSIAWKNGYFDFSHEKIDDIMRNISRWYDVDIIYEKNITREEFIGSVSRYKNVGDVLNMLELTGAVHFRVEGRRITVMP
jgi:transmembrane sensor